MSLCLTEDVVQREVSSLTRPFVNNITTVGTVERRLKSVPANYSSTRSSQPAITQRQSIVEQDSGIPVSINDRGAVDDGKKNHS